MVPRLAVLGSGRSDFGEGAGGSEGALTDAWIPFQRRTPWTSTRRAKISKTAKGRYRIVIGASKGTPVDLEAALTPEQVVELERLLERWLAGDGNSEEPISDGKLGDRSDFVRMRRRPDVRRTK